MATNAQRRLAEREQERLRDDSEKRSVWGFIWVLFVFKLVTVGTIWWAATSTHSRETSFIIATTWYWFLIPIVAISGPLLLRWRLLRMRRRRDELRGAEWMERHGRDDAPSSPLTIDDILCQHDRKSA